MVFTASRYPDSWLQELRERNDIVQTVSSYVSLKKKGKTWWGLCDYRLRSQAGFMTLINLNSVLYAITSMLPHLDENLASLVNLSIQERRARIGRTLDKKRILSTFVKECVTHGNSGEPCYCL